MLLSPQIRPNGKVIHSKVRRPKRKVRLVRERGGVSVGGTKEQGTGRIGKTESKQSQQQSVLSHSGF